MKCGFPASVPGEVIGLGGGPTRNIAVSPGDLLRSRGEAVPVREAEVRRRWRASTQDPALRKQAARF